MSVLKYIVKKFELKNKQTKILLTNCHRDNVCHCYCHTSAMIMHCMPCCHVAICPTCKQKYNQKRA